MGFASKVGEAEMISWYPERSIASRTARSKLTRCFGFGKLESCVVITLINFPITVPRKTSFGPGESWWRWKLMMAADEIARFAFVQRDFSWKNIEQWETHIADLLDYQLIISASPTLEANPIKEGGMAESFRERKAITKRGFLQSTLLRCRDRLSGMRRLSLEIRHFRSLKDFHIRWKAVFGKNHFQERAGLFCGGVLTAWQKAGKKARRGLLIALISFRFKLLSEWALFWLLRHWS